MSYKVLQLHKRSSYEFKHIQDKFSLDADSGIYCIADGTTQSFRSETWAELLVSGFSKRPVFNREEAENFFISKATEFNEIEFELSANPAMASLEREKLRRGATTTFLAIGVEKDRLSILACGDSNLFLIDANGQVTSFPFTNMESLDSNHSFLNTVQLISGDFDKESLISATLDLPPGSSVLLATDALSRFILEYPEKLTDLLSISSFDELRELCEYHWSLSVLQEDDITALLIFPDKNPTGLTIYPPDDFSYPKEEVVEFIPSTINHTTQETEDMDNQLKSYLNHVSQVTTLIRKEQKLNQMLIIGVLGMLLSISIYLVFAFNDLKDRAHDNNLLIDEITSKEYRVKAAEREILLLRKQLRDSKRPQENLKEVKDTSTAPVGID